MKVKKVEIQAFRAYDKPGEGIFDFLLPGNEVANFVSIYAPNGFGKTSFYDAVEYGITKNISRFLKRSDVHKEAAKSEREISKKKKKQYILRNRLSSDELESEIKIYTSTSDKPIVRKVDKPKTSGNVDFTFDKNKVEHKYFQTVILSQEWIDAFLREENPEERYKKFIAFFGDAKVDEYYRKVTEIIQHTDKILVDLKKELQGLQLKLDFDGDPDILSKINSTSTN